MADCPRYTTDTLEPMSLMNKTTHAVVEFNDYGQKSIELVLSSWLCYEKRRWYCLYPTGANLQFASRYVQMNRNPETSWAKHKVTIMQEASNYEQGIRRLNRLCEGEEVAAAASILSSTADPASVMQKVLDCNDQNDDDHSMQSTVSITGDQMNQRHEFINDAAEREDSFNKKEIPIALKGMENRIRKKLGRVEQNILFEVRAQFKNLLRTVVPSESLKSVGETITKCKAKLDVEEINCRTLEEFEALEVKLSVEECRKALKAWMLIMQNNSRDVKESVSKVLTAYVAKSVQLQFSGCGRKIKGAGKMDFSATHAYACLRDVLFDVHNCDPNTIRSTVSRWLSGAGDREGGKKGRSSSV